MGLIVFLFLNLMSPYTRRGPIRFTVLSFSPSGDGRPPGSSSPGLPGAPRPTGSPSVPLKAEKSKSDENSKRSERLETIKQKKSEQSRETNLVEGLKSTRKKTEKPEREKESAKSLQDALEDIHKKMALDEIQKRVARRPGTEKRVAEGPSPSSSQGPISSLPSAKGPSAGSPGSGTEKGTGPGRGTGTGTGTGSGGSPWGSSGLDSRLNDYYSLIWAKIKEGWTLPENLPKERVDLEAIIVLVIDKGGKLQRSWFEKKSGSALYDQMAMRAIKKAEPFPPIPKELGDDSLEIGIRFYPE
jgi:TonB family protein